MKKALSLKSYFCMAIAASGFLAAGPAQADPAANWAGPYIGGFVGGSFADFGNTTNSNPGGDDASFLGGGDIGTNWQYGHMVIGAEGDFSKIDNHSGYNGVKFTEDWMATARARAGFAMDRFLPYVTGGIAVTDTVSKVSGVGSGEALQPGYVIGGGVDTMLTGNWFGRVEYLHVDVPRDNATIGTTRVAGGSANDVVRVGLNYKF